MERPAVHVTSDRVLVMGRGKRPRPPLVDGKKAIFVGHLGGLAARSLLYEVRVITPGAASPEV